MSDHSDEFLRRLFADVDACTTRRELDQTGYRALMLIAVGVSHDSARVIVGQVYGIDLVIRARALELHDVVLSELELWRELGVR